MGSTTSHLSEVLDFPAGMNTTDTTTTNTNPDTGLNMQFDDDTADQEDDDTLTPKRPQEKLEVVLEVVKVVVVKERVPLLMSKIKINHSFYYPLNFSLYYFMIHIIFEKEIKFSFIFYYYYSFFRYLHLLFIFFFKNKKMYSLFYF